MRTLGLYIEKNQTITMTTPGVILSMLAFWLIVYWAVHAHNSNNEQISKMGRPERFAMELLSSSAAAIAIMFTLGFIDMGFKAWM